MLRPVVACHDQLEQATAMSRSSQPLEAAMRATNKHANGKNWTIRQLKGRTQIKIKLEDGSKPSVLTEIPPQPDKATETQRDSGGQILSEGWRKTPGGRSKAFEDPGRRRATQKFAICGPRPGLWRRVRF